MNSTTALASPLIAALALVTGLVGALGARFELIAPLAGYVLFAFLMPLVAVFALILGLIGLLRTRRRQRRGGASQAWAGVVLSTLILVCILGLRQQTAGVPPIHDVTTNITDPPPFEAAASEDSRGNGFAYPSGSALIPNTPDLQRQSYPDLATLQLDIAPREAMRRVRLTAEAMGWDQIGANEESGHLEFADRTSWFRFVDFIAVRVQPGGSGETGAAVDIRSVSQVGISDMGKNAARIRRFVERLGAGD